LVDGWYVCEREYNLLKNAVTICKLVWKELGWKGVIGVDIGLG